MPTVGDLVSAIDRLGQGVVGEVIACCGEVVHVQPNRLKDNAGKYIDLAPVMVDVATCSVVERRDERETNAQREARYAAFVQAMTERQARQRERLIER